MRSRGRDRRRVRKPDDLLRLHLDRNNLNGCLGRLRNVLPRTADFSVGTDRVGLISGCGLEAVVSCDNGIGEALHRCHVVVRIDAVIKVDALTRIDAQQRIAVIIGSNDLCRAATQYYVVGNYLAFTGRFIDFSIAVIVQAVGLERINVDQVGRICVAGDGHVIGRSTGNAASRGFIRNRNPVDVGVERVAVVRKRYEVGAARTGAVYCFVTDFLVQDQPRLSDREVHPATELGWETDCRWSKCVKLFEVCKWIVENSFECR